MPCGPCAPWEPAGPATPWGPAGPCAPAAPVAPWMPCGPWGPSAPAGPTPPTDPCGPAGPAGPSGPAGPAGPTRPSRPAGPSGPAGPCDPCVPLDEQAATESSRRATDRRLTGTGGCAKTTPLVSAHNDAHRGGSVAATGVAPTRCDTHSLRQSAGRLGQGRAGARDRRFTLDRPSPAMRVPTPRSRTSTSLGRSGSCFANMA